MNPSYQNELVKRKYFKYLKGAEGLSDSTIDCINNAIVTFEDFQKLQDFRKNFNPDRITEFKEWLRKKEFKNQPISLSTRNAHLRHLRKFFIWLASQPGYKSKIRLDAIGYLRLRQSEERIAGQSPPREFPSLEHVKSLVKSITGMSEIEMRDRALISFTLLSGMRDAAIVSLPLGNVDIDKLSIHQRPKDHVKTKFSYDIESIIFKFDEELFEYVRIWIEYLAAKGFKKTDPLFPRAKVCNFESNRSFDKASEVEPVYYTSASSMRNMIKNRSEEAKLRYYPPHTYRHLASNFALENCTRPEQYKAVSQNFGHKHIRTTFATYGNYPIPKMTEILTSMDFTGKDKELDAETKAKFRSYMEKFL